MHWSRRFRLRLRRLHKRNRPPQHGHGHGHGHHDMQADIDADARRFVRLPTNRKRGIDDSVSEHVLRLGAAWSVIIGAETAHFVVEKATATRSLHGGVGVIAQGIAEKVSTLRLWAPLGRSIDAVVSKSASVLGVSRLAERVTRIDRVRDAGWFLRLRVGPSVTNAGARFRRVMKQPAGKFAGGFLMSTGFALFTLPVLTALGIGLAAGLGRAFGRRALLAVHPAFGLDHKHHARHDAPEPVRPQRPMRAADPRLGRELDARTAQQKAIERLGPWPGVGSADRKHAHLWDQLTSLYLSARGTAQMTWLAGETASRQEADILLRAHHVMPHRRHHWSAVKKRERLVTDHYMEALAHHRNADERARGIDTRRTAHEIVGRCGYLDHADACLLTQCRLPHLRHACGLKSHIDVALFGAKVTGGGLRITSRRSITRLALLLDAHSTMFEVASFLDVFEAPTRRHLVQEMFGLPAKRCGRVSPQTVRSADHFLRWLHPQMNGQTVTRADTARTIAPMAP